MRSNNLKNPYNLTNLFERPCAIRAAGGWVAVRMIGLPVVLRLNEFSS